MSELIKVDRSLLSSQSLAYIGDAIYEVYIRLYVLQLGIKKQKYVNERVKRYVSANAQSKIMKQLLEQSYLTEFEIMLFKQGRNAKSGSIPKNTSIQAYKYSTGFESLLGYLYLSDNVRMNAIIEESIKICEVVNVK